MNRDLAMALLVVAVGVLSGCQRHERNVGPRLPPATALDPAVKQEVELATGIRMRFREAGHPGGEPVLLLHGITDTSRSFLPTMRHLARLRPDLHLYALDQRGHGDSSMPAAEPCRSVPEECFGPAQMAADAIAFLDARGIESAHLVGHSMGSTVAQEVALSRPERVRRLVLIGTSARFGGTPAVEEFLLAGLIEGRWKESIERQGLRWPDDAYELLPSDADPEAETWMRESWVADPVADPSLLAEILPETLHTALGTWIGAVRALCRHDNVERLRRLTTPTLVLWAIQDSMFLESPDQETLREVLGASPARWFFKTYGRRPLPPSGLQETDLGHNLQWGAPNEVALDLASFLRDGGEPTPDLYFASPQDPRRVETAAGEAVVLRHP